MKFQAEQTAIKAIETQYQGYRFRSRLEARWAVFFDAVGLLPHLRYEAEGFDLGDGLYYLPDFVFGDRWFIEIKPRTASKNELAKAERLAKVTRGFVMILSGDVWWNHDGTLLQYGDRAERCSFISCPNCRVIALAVGPSQKLHVLADILCFGQCDIHKYRPTIPNLDALTKLRQTPELMQAYQAARSARFEHGENGRPQW